MRKHAVVLSITGLIVLGGLGILRWGITSPSLVEAGKFRLENNDIYYSTVDNSRRVTTGGDVLFLYGEQNGRLLAGKKTKDALPSSEQVETVNLVVIDGGTGMQEQLAENVEWAAYDKSGREKVVYVNKKAEVSIYDLATRQSNLVASKALNPDISFDGSKVVYKKLAETWQVGDYLDGSPGLSIVEVGTGKEIQLTNETEDYAPFWSSDGNYIFFYSTNPAGLISLYMVDADGNNRTQLTNLGQEFVSSETIDSPSELPVWSTTGRHFVYESDRRIWVHEVDFANRRLVSAKVIGFGVMPTWSQDGTQILVVSARGKAKDSSIITLDLEGNIIK
ncbi:hypothetical protein K2Q16_02895 [Patescibacteria group bacterium]|nr:hypothetical protein [Patescibacteria group bacterium]